MSSAVGPQFYVDTLPSSSLNQIENWVIAVGGIVAGALALCAVVVLAVIVMKQWAGTPDMVRISRYIQEGANGFLKREYQILGIFVLLVMLGLGLSSLAYVTYPSLTSASLTAPPGWQAMLCFLAGSTLSALCGFIGMTIATRANVRTTAAAMKSGLNAALRVAFNSGSVMGLSVVGLGLAGVSSMFIAFPNFTHLAGFGFGASSIALFARVGGGIFTKAADVGSDLVGKVEAGIPEDDPRNPGVIADNVGDNVGDVAGMGADLFESYVGSIIAAGSLGVTRFSVSGTNVIVQSVAQSGTQSYALAGIPFWLGAAGIIASIIGVLFVRTRDPKPEENLSRDEQQGRLLTAIRTGIIVSAIVVMGVAVAVVLVLGADMRVWGAIVIGLLAGVAIGFFTEFATSFTYSPTKSIARAGKTGPATVVIQGLSVGMWSAVPPVLIIVVTIISCLYLCGQFGVALAAVGMLSTLGMTLATDAYGPVADNAGGIAEMCEDVPRNVRDLTDALDALGNTTAATGKGFAIGSAVLTALALVNAFTAATGITSADIMVDRGVVPGLLLGAMLPFLFASLTMKAVGDCAMEIVEEIRRQFRELHLLTDKNAKADYARCVAIAMGSSLRQMIVPGLVAIISPIFIGLLLGAKALVGLLIGAICTGFLLAVTMANAGGAWDNAKKFVEAGGIPGVKKGTDWHAAVVVGDTVGDPFKDTSGPSLNILIKLMSIVSLMLAPLFSQSEPFLAPDYWIGLIVLGVCLLALIIYGIVRCCRKPRVEINTSSMKDSHDTEMQKLHTGDASDTAPAAHSDAVAPSDVQPATNF